jgi:PAS domain S-box-containing protein
MSESRKKSILLVEDEALIAMTEKMQLEKYGYSVQTVTSGEKAIEAVRETPELDLILMDIDLGRGMDGTEAAERILRERDMPVVFLSSHTSPEIVEKTEKITSYGYVVKNSSITVLDASIKMAFKLFDAQTAFKRAEEDLRKSENRLNLATRSANLGIWDWDISNNVMTWNDQMFRLYGVAEVPEEYGVEIWMDGLHPDDRNLALDAVESAIRGEKEYDLEFRVQWADGTVRYVHGTGVVIRAEDGTAIRMTGINDDITERKQMEETMEKRLVALTRPLDDTGEINLEELFSIAELQHLQDQFARATGVASIITFPDGTPITRPSSFRPLCNDIIRKTEIGRANCFKSDAAIGRPNPNGPTVQPCLSCGLWDAGAAITVGGRHIANWLAGQVRDEAQTEEKMREYARDIGADEDEVAEAFREVPAMSHQRFRRISEMLFSFTNQLSKIAYQNVQQARFISELRRAEAETQRQLTEEETLIREVHHRVKNNITAMERLLMLQADSSASGELKEALQDTISRVQSTRILYEKLMLQEDTHQVSIPEYAAGLIEALVQVFDPNGTVRIDTRITDFRLDAKKAFSLGIIINELLTNAFKHAFGERGTGLVSIAVDKEDDNVVLIVHDDGVGFSENAPKPDGSGFGLTVVRMLAEQSGGTYNRLNDNGTRNVVRLRLERALRSPAEPAGNRLQPWRCCRCGAPIPWATPKTGV